MDIDLNKNSFCLTCNISRYKYLCDCFKVVGLQPPKLFPGIHHPVSGAEGCKIGHMSIIMLARCLCLPYTVVFEDDAYPRKDVIDKFNVLLKELDSIDPNWGMMNLGRSGEISFWDKDTELFWAFNRTDSVRNSYKSRVKLVGNGFISIPKNSNGSHAYVIKKECYNEWLHSLALNKYSDIAMGQKNFTKHKVYWTKEMLFTTKQIDNNCMTSLGSSAPNKRMNLFIYPYNYNKNYMGVASIFKEPPKGFVEELVKK